MFRGCVIMDVETLGEARTAEQAGAFAVTVLQSFAADIHEECALARMSDPKIIKTIKDSVKIPVFAKARIGHFVEAQILQQIGVDFIDESEVLTPADQERHIDKHKFQTPFICGCKNLGEALRRIREGALVIRTEGHAGSGNVVETVRQIRSIIGDIQKLINMDNDEVLEFANSIFAPYNLVMQTKQLGRLPAVQLGAGGISTPADAALLMRLGCDGVIVGSGIFVSEDPVERARAIVEATRHYNDPAIVADVSSGLGEAWEGVVSDVDDTYDEGMVRLTL
ncbi:probable pyridoxal 5'-phosphate synthase subunit PDX1 [Cynara cardunculus var. scolymus]|nr:probable pyridoxal 5'-phosphate synthase subunit PDX1 [Cynara cardunculus var. scolymus]